MKHSLLCGALILLSTSLPAQVLHEDFGNPGTSQDPVPGWTVRSGKWEIYKGRLVSDGSQQNHYITWNAAGLPRNCVIDADVYQMRSTLQYAGITARFSTPAANLLAKAQQNSGASRGFDRQFIYEYGPGTTQHRVIKAPSVAAKLRLVVADNFFWTEIDLDRDGIFDQKIGPQTISQQLGGARVGVAIWGWSEIDNVQLFNAVLSMAPLNRPRVGGHLQLELRGPKAKADDFIIGLSQGNTGFDLGTVRIPLTADALLTASLDAGLRGRLQSNGKGVFTVPIPNDPALVGFRAFAAALLLDPGRPLQVVAVSNELFFELR